MQRVLAAAFAGICTIACGAPPPEAGAVVDSAALRVAELDSLRSAARAQAPALRDSAQATLAALLDNPATAGFDSVVVVQPPADGDRLPGLVVCGRITGRPGPGGNRAPVRFVYQNRWTVFVEEASNREQFAELWARTCAAPGSSVVEG